MPEQNVKKVLCRTDSADVCELAHNECMLVVVRLLSDFGGAEVAPHCQ